MSKTKNKKEILEEGLLEKVLEFLPVGVWIMDKNGKIIFGNKEGQKIWSGAKYVAKDKFGEYKGWWLDSGKKIKAEEWAAARAISKGEISINEKIEIECFDKSRKIILNSALPIKNKKGEVEGGIIVNQDITEDFYRERELIQSKEEYKKIFDNSPIGMAVLSLEGKWLQVNDNLVDMLGYSRDKFLKMDFQNVTHKDDLSKDLKLLQDTLKGKISRYKVEKRYIHKDGHFVYCILSVSLVKDSKNKPLFFISQIQDISDIKESELKLKKKLDEYEKINKLMVGRELQMIKLKEELKKLKK